MWQGGEIKEGVMEKIFPERDLSQVPRKYYGQWVAIDTKRNNVIAAASSMKEVAEKAAIETKSEFFVTMLKPCAGGYLL